MPKKAKFGFGSSSNVEEALQNGKIDTRDIVFLDEDTDNPKVGWVTLDGKIVTAKADLSEIEADVSAIETKLESKANAKDVETLESQIANKADAETVKAMETELANKVSADEVDAKVETAVKTEVESVVKSEVEKTAEKVKYEVVDVPDGTLIDYAEHEIRIMCPENSVFTKQDVGEGGDANSYYVTFKTYVHNDNVVGYKEHLGDLVDTEILTDLKTDEYGRRYQPTWLAVAKYDEANDTWTYYGENSTSNKMVGWDYQLDLFNADGKMIESDSIRINLSNEDCHFVIEPYYMGEVMTEVEALVNQKIEQINTGYEIIEF